MTICDRCKTPLTKADSRRPAPVSFAGRGINWQRVNVDNEPACDAHFCSDCEDHVFEFLRNAYAVACTLPTSAATKEVPAQ